MWLNIAIIISILYFVISVMSNYSELVLYKLTVIQASVIMS
jgi:hypothetical protein